MTRTLAALLAALALSACGSANAFNTACVNDSDCTKGQICPGLGPMQGRCTKSCTKDDDCSGLTSGHVVCSSNVCVQGP